MAGDSGKVRDQENDSLESSQSRPEVFPQTSVAWAGQIDIKNPNGTDLQGSSPLLTIKTALMRKQIMSWLAIVSLSWVLCYQKLRKIDLHI